VEHVVRAAVVVNDDLVDADVVVDNAVLVDADTVAAATHTAKQTLRAPWSALLVHCWRLRPRCCRHSLRRRHGGRYIRRRGRGHLLLCHRRVRCRRDSGVPSCTCRAHPEQRRRREGRVEHGRGAGGGRGRQHCAPVPTREVPRPSAAPAADREVPAAAYYVSLSHSDARKGGSQRGCRCGRYPPQMRPPPHTLRVAGHDGALRRAVAGCVRRRLAQQRARHLSRAAAATRVGSRDPRKRA